MLQKIFGFLFFLPVFTFAQTTADIFPDLEGDALLDALVQSYKPNPADVLSYGDARDVLFGIIDREDNYVSCIYTGHQVYLPNGEDPSTYIYQNGSPNGINAEHTFPQSMGAEFGAAKSDMHHLFPARVAVNTARGSLPFAEIQDFETDWWYYLNTEQSSIPSTNRDAYSEGTNYYFEPRESVKGDIARAMFYFYTMYKSQADNANSSFFDNQKNRLCHWHYLDPADQAEINRTNLIAVYQDEKPNPFILDCTVATRCYCEENPACPLTATEELEESTQQITLFPNPAQEEIVLSFDKITWSTLHFQLLNINGVLQSEQVFVNDSTQINFQLMDLPSSLYFYQIVDKNGKNISRGKLIIL